MNVTAGRLALVVASQSPAMPFLTALETAAHDLESALLEPTVGACRPANGDVASVVGELDEQTIRGAVSDAIARAGEQRATLVLAFLGHGFVAGRSLYFMHRDSDGEVRNRAVNIDSVLADAFDQPGVDGVLAILDVCSAGAAVPSAQDLVSGVRNGRTSTTIIMASAANQPASQMRFTHSLVEVMRRGVAGHGPVLTVDVVVEELRRRVSGQDVSSATFNGDPFGAIPWLARNGQAPRAPGRPHPLAVERRALSRDDLQTMTRLLLDVPAFSNHADARALVLNLPAQVHELILPPAVPWLDIPMMLRVFEDHPQLGLWPSLIDALDQSAPGPAVERLKLEALRLGLIE